MSWNLQAPWLPTGDQPQAIKKLNRWLTQGHQHQTLLGATGSGKTFTIANVIAQQQRNSLVIAPNKTLAAQLASELAGFFPQTEVHYFVSYYDYYQPEAYLPKSDIYIAKETLRNQEIERLKHASTQALIADQPTIIVASVSCIYGLGSPQNYRQQIYKIKTDTEIKRQDFLKKLHRLQFKRTPNILTRSQYRVKGDVVDIYPTKSIEDFVRVEFWGDLIEKISLINSLSLKKTNPQPLTEYTLFPAVHHTLPGTEITKIIKNIKLDLENEVADFNKQGRPEVANRLQERTLFDLEMLAQTGNCNGIENYSRYLENRPAGAPAYTLLDYFPKNFLVFIDESHLTIPQIRAMYNGDQARKQNLINHGFRLKSALDNRPLTFAEFTQKIKQFIYISATPQDYELELSTKKRVAEQLIRPTHIVDPKIIIKPNSDRIPDLLQEINKRQKKQQRTLITVLTKKTAEELDIMLQEKGIKSTYLHSEVKTLQRVEILEQLSKGKFDVLIGVNLLREGLDLPNVSLVAILDADQAGFLRSTTALIQTIGRAARHLEGTVIMYADQRTPAMETAIEETDRRRQLQTNYNLKNNTQPTGITKKVRLLNQTNTEIEELVFPPSSPGYRQYVTNQINLALKNNNFRQADYLQDKLTEYDN